MMTVLINFLRLEYEGLYPVLMIALVLFAYGVTASLGGNGFLAVYIAGLIVGNSDFIHRRSLIRFHDGLAWLMQITMFLALGLLVFPSRLEQIIIPGLLTAGFLIIIARPLSVFASLLNARLSVREKLFISGVGLRGAAPIILATFPLLAGVEKADAIFNLVFFVVLTSVLLQGTSLVPLAKLLRLDAPSTPPTPTLELIATNDLKNKLVEMTIPAHSAIQGKRIVDLGLPEGSLIVLISRDYEVIVPGGSTELQSGDNLLVFANQDVLRQVQSLIDSQLAETE
jgi:cell volume regulation protein A